MQPMVPVWIEVKEHCVLLTESPYLAMRDGAPEPAITKVHSEFFPISSIDISSVVLILLL